jgi:hypothetical protein
MLGLPLWNSAEGRRLKERGLDVIESYPNDQWVQKARAIAEMLAAKNGEVTMDEILKVLPRPPDVHPNSCGAVFRGKRWKQIGTKQSEQVSRHAGIIRIWKLT